MSFLSDIESPFKKVIDKVEAIVPASWKDEFGKLAHAYAANILHDFESALAAGFTEFKTLTAPMLETIASTVEKEAVSLAPAVLSGKISLTDAVSAGVKNLTSDALTSVVPELKVVAEATLTTILRSFGASAVAALGASPTAPPSKLASS